MHQLVDGRWQRGGFRPKMAGGAYDRPDSQFRGWVEDRADAEFPAAPNRYHLYVSLACPWAHRTLIVRALKKLDHVIGVSVVDPRMSDEGWTFGDCDGCTRDTVNGFQALHQIYSLSSPFYTGIVTVPVLFDTRERRIVNNESSEIIRMLNGAFDAWGDASVDLYPEPLRTEIDAINAFVYEPVNNGVYLAGFATDQARYESVVTALFDALDVLEARLGRQRYLVGDRITEADWRLFTTLIRFDTVYHGHFKCNLRRLVDYPNLWAYTRELYQVPGIAETVDFEHIKQHYYWSQSGLNPSRIVPAGPALDLDAPHGRGGRRAPARRRKGTDRP